LTAGLARRIDQRRAKNGAGGGRLQVELNWIKRIKQNRTESG
jgi:hypothetical protein